MKLSIITLALVATVSIAEITQLPLWRSPEKKLGPRNTLLNAKTRFGINVLPNELNARQIPLRDFSDELYTTTVTFGNGQNFKVDLDTGSSDVWIRGADCTSSDQSCSSTTQATFDTSDTTVSDQGQTFSVSYGSGAASGEIYYGPVSLGGISANINFGVSTSETGFNSPADGLWGLAYASINQIDGGNYVSAAGISSLAFYFSDAADGDTGELTIDGVDATKFTGSLKYVPISSQSFYQLNPSGGSFNVNGKKISITDTSAIVDTGTTLLLAPNRVAKALNIAIGASSFDSTQGIYPIECGIKSSGPSITVKLGSALIVIAPSQYVLTNTDGTCFSGISQIGSLSGAGPAYIFGDTFMRAAYTIFDIQNSRIGFAQAVHPNA